MIQTQYRQAIGAILSENVSLVLMAVSAATHTDWRIVAGWTLCELATQAYRTVFMMIPYAKGAPKENFAAYWARHHAIYQTAIAFVWGATMFLFAHQQSPISVALTLCTLVIITSGAVPGLAYNPPAMMGFFSVIFLFILARLLQFQTLDYNVLAGASLAYAGVLALMGRMQTQLSAESIRIRFENIELLDTLTVRTADADAARAAAEQASLAKSQFLAAASHDLRQPLYALSLSSGSLQALELGDDARQIVGQMQANFGALEGLFNGLLDISRLEAGVIVVKREPISADELFDRLDHYLRPIAEELGLDLRYRSDGSAIDSDPALIEQILINLGSNALRNTRKGGVLIAARRRGLSVRLEVWDTGVGIADEDRARIFEDFVQVGNPERNRRKGMGLGLAIARRSAGLLESEIEVASRPGRGSVFYLTQPAGAHAPTLPPPATRNDSRDPIAGLRVLIIDDDPEVREALRSLMRQWGVAADIMGDSEAGLGAVAEGARYAAVLSDYRLPGPINGLDLIERLVAQGLPRSACCIVTGDLDPAVITAATEAKIALVHKPVSPARLRALIIHLASETRTKA